MNANRTVSLTISGSLVAVVLIAVLFFGVQQTARGSDQLQNESEAQSGSENRISHYAGPSPSMGNLGWYDLYRMQPASRAAPTGFGDLRKFENQLGTVSNANADPVGMGDLHLFDAAREGL